MSENTKNDIKSVLVKCGFFGKVSEELLSEIIRISKVMRYDKGDLIFAEYSPCVGMYIVATGAVKIYKIGVDGREHVLHVAETGDTFGEVALFMGDAGYPAYASTVKNSTMIFIPKKPILSLLESEPRMATQVLGSLAMWTHKLVMKLEYLTLKDASSRLAGYILQQTSNSKRKDFELSIPKQTLAAHLAISSETLSRLLTRFEAQMIIESSGKHISVRDFDVLREISELGAADGQS
ncbi:MAG: Crp/Fnr family transcriptional regulator [Armatimonadota bacterium]